MYYYYPQEECQEQSSKLCCPQIQAQREHVQWADLASPQSSGGNMFNAMAVALSGPREYWL